MDEIAALLKQALVRIEVLEAENQRLRDRVPELEKELVEEQRKGKRLAAPFHRCERAGSSFVVSIPSR